MIDQIRSLLVGIYLVCRLIASGALVEPPDDV